MQWVAEAEIMRKIRKEKDKTIQLMSSKKEEEDGKK